MRIPTTPLIAPNPGQRKILRTVWLRTVLALGISGAAAGLLKGGPGKGSQEESVRLSRPIVSSCKTPSR